VPSVAELAARIKALNSAHTIEAAPERMAKRHASAEEPVTARIYRALAVPPTLAEIEAQGGEAWQQKVADAAINGANQGAGRQ